MQINSVNVGKERPIESKSGTSGIFKEPSSNPVFIGELGLENDAIIDVENHGGVDQAVYIYGTSDYDWWSQELNLSMPVGIFGENLTITELESASLCIGDRLQMDSVILEVTSPRIPCVTLATRMDDPKFVKRFVQAERYGAYCRVIQTGHIQASETIKVIRYDGLQVGINEMATAFYSGKIDKAQLERFLSVPVAIRARHDYEEQLSKL